ncbi:hypothetical protein PUN28_018663 [Cardiocondyla obscurior]|uniref:Uncharacterized protein n=1 Tax=Cardiocondyla obscurior TaxID=286306 RepID=A0AAW2EEZ5_9HYME
MCNILKNNFIKSYLYYSVLIIASIHVCPTLMHLPHKIRFAAIVISTVLSIYTGLQNRCYSVQFKEKMLEDNVIKNVFHMYK